MIFLLFVALRWHNYDVLFLQNCHILLKIGLIPACLLYEALFSITSDLSNKSEMWRRRTSHFAESFFIFEMKYV